MDRAAFARYVHECLNHLHDPAYLEIHPLAAIVRDDGSRPGETVRRVLLSAIERLKPADGARPSSLESRRYQCMRLRFEGGLGLEQVARQLGVSARQASRDQAHALNQVVGLLWAAYGPRDAHVPGLAVRAPAIAHQAEGALPTELQDELLRLAAAQDETPTDLGESIRGVVATVTRLAEARGVEIEVSLSDVLPPVAAGRTLVRQALFNLATCVIGLAGGSRLLISALDTPRGVKVSLDARRRRGHPAARLGEPAADTEAPLRAAQRLLEATGGSAELRRHADGSLIVDAYLPPVQMHTVLVVDDNPDLVGLFRRYLRGTSYRLIHAGTAAAALRLAGEMRPDAITLDLMMPSQDGWEILQRLRSDEATRNTPVLICSVLPERELAQSLGVAEFVPKPVTRAGLLAALDRCLRGTLRPASPDSPATSASPRQR